MLEKIRNVFQGLRDWLFCKTPAENTYCIPCKWILAGHVYVDAPDIETAKAYIRTHNSPPQIEECVCYRMEADVNHPVLCTCGNCGNGYLSSATYNSRVCPKCGNGGEC